MNALKRTAAAAATVALMGGAAMLASTTADAATTPLSVSLYANGDSSATWNAAGDPVLTAGTSSGTSAQLQIKNVQDTQAPATAPSFTPSAFGGGDPRWVLEFHNGCYLFGYPNENNTDATAWAANPGGPQSTDYASAVTWAKACGSDDNLTSVFVVDDAGGHSLSAVTLTDVQYNGQTLAPVAKTGPGRISNSYSHKCLDVTGANYAVGGLLQQWACGANGGADQQFQIVTYPDGNSYLQAVNGNGAVFNVTSLGSTAANRQLVLETPWNGTGNQVMVKSGPYYTFPGDSLAMDDAGYSTSNGAEIIGYPQNGGANQQWSLP